MAEPSENLILEAGSVKETEDMPMEEAWKKFMTTGSVTDYLTFKGVDTFTMPAESSTSTAWGEQPDGKQYCGDRDGLTGNADWRI